MNINIYNPYVRQELELYHHGIAGMRWGKKNGPPYPLAASAHSASEKKAGWRKSLNGGSGKTSRKKTSSKSVKTSLKQKLSNITPEQKAKAKKIAVIALAVVGTVAVAALAEHGITTLNTNNVIKLKKVFEENTELYAKRDAAEDKYIADFIGRTGYQRMLDMRDRHPRSQLARRAVESAWNQHLKSRDRTLDIGRAAKIAKNKLSYYNNPLINPVKKLESQLFKRPIY